MEKIAEVVWREDELLGELARNGYELSQENLDILSSNRVRTTEGLVRI
jgi:hypothetical protein